MSTETLDDNGKMLYLTLEKAPQLTGLGPWMGVVQGEKQVDSDYPEEKKASYCPAVELRVLVAFCHRFVKIASRNDPLYLQNAKKKTCKNFMP